MTAMKSSTSQEWMSVSTSCPKKGMSRASAIFWWVENVFGATRADLLMVLLNEDAERRDAACGRGGLRRGAALRLFWVDTTHFVAERLPKDERFSTGRCIDGQRAPELAARVRT
jgi:hypothetical protein